MYAKLNAGGANYDLVQPTDYIVAPMIRQGLLQELDKSKLPVLRTTTRTISTCPSTRTTSTRFRIRPAPTPWCSTPTP